MKSFQQWQDERKRDGDQISKVGAIISVFGLLGYATAVYFQFHAQTIWWIYLVLLTLHGVITIPQLVVRYRNLAKEATAEKAEMEQRWACEDMELNATILLPRER